MRQILMQLWPLCVLSLGVAVSLSGYASPPVTLDPTFGVGGILRVPAVNVSDTVLQPDGKLLVRGLRLGQATISRYNRDGSVDIGFGSGGVSEPKLNGSPLYGSGSVLVLADGRILTTGETIQPCGINNCAITVVVRLLANGSLDTTFGTGGFTALAQGAGGSQGGTLLALQQDEKIVALENFSSGGFFPIFMSTIERLSADGVSEAHWSNPCTPLGSDITVQLDGKTVVAGAEFGPQCIARFNLDGTLDPSFGTNGIVQLRSPSGPDAPTLLIDPRDPLRRIVATRRFTPGSGVLLPGTITRLLPNGTIDPAFGSSLNNHMPPNRATRLTLSCGAKFVGSYGSLLDIVPPDPASGLNVVRYNSNGTPDVTFSGDSSGQIFTPLNDFASNFVQRIFVRDDGDIIVVAGYELAGATNADLLVAAYRQADCTHPYDSQSLPVIEYYYASLDHYFITSFVDDVNALDSGHFPGWSRTGYTFNASNGSDGLVPVCRFYIPPPYGDSHFFSASSAECAAVASRFPQFVLETPNAMKVGLPDPATGLCPAPTSMPVYRVWDNRLDTNHRYTTDRSVRDAMVAAKWVAEGYGPDAVAMCALPQ
jgi:uncharacterized delta-60 repeat protein